METPESYHLSERHIYGSSRVGMITEKVEYAYTYSSNAMVGINEDDFAVEDRIDVVFTTTLGYRQYELSNHLGNVLSVIGDQKLPIVQSGVVQSFVAYVISSQDYSPFGVTLSGRNWSGEEYRYGFNGKEKDNESFAGAYDFGARILDVRLGRWMGVDKMWSDYPSLTTYNFVSNCPLMFVDPNGNEIRIYFGNGENDFVTFKPEMDVSSCSYIAAKAAKAILYNMNTDIGKESWNQLINSDEVLIIRPSTDVENNFDPTKNDKQTNDGKTIIGEINWDYDSALTVQTESGVDDKGVFFKGLQAPSTALFHELGHALELLSQMKINDPKLREEAINKWKSNYNSLPKDSDDYQYDNIEERRNIVNVEQVYIKAINAWEQTRSIEDPSYTPLFQPVRYNHKGGKYESPGSKRLGVNETPDGGQNYVEWRASIISGGGEVDDGIK